MKALRYYVDARPHTGSQAMITARDGYWVVCDRRGEQPPKAFAQRRDARTWAKALNAKEGKAS